VKAGYPQRLRAVKNGETKKPASKIAGFLITMILVILYLPVAVFAVYRSVLARRERNFGLLSAGGA
jgi:hypothetical protein